jgi:hypothetical protein
MTSCRQQKDRRVAVFLHPITQKEKTKKHPRKEKQREEHCGSVFYLINRELLENPSRKIRNFENWSK